jgi:hypothetical protein
MKNYPFLMATFNLVISAAGAGKQPPHALLFFVMANAS